MEGQDRYTVTYRANETRQVMKWIKAGQCGSIIGLRGAGKSNFNRFLLRTNVQQRYLGQNQANFTFVLINLLSLTERSEWGLYEMILNNLFVQLHPPDIADEMILEVSALHHEMMHTRDVLTAERAVERCVALLCQQPDWRLVLLFDEFDAVFRDLPAALFRCLRAIRDSYKDQISYIVVATHDLTGLRHDLTEEMDHFYRLVRRNLCWLGPYCEADARQMTGYLASRRSQELSEKDTARLYELSGGHAGLLKAILSLLWNGNDLGQFSKLTPMPAAPSRHPFENESAIVSECQKIWDSLSEDEKADLSTFANGDLLAEHAIKHLIVRGLLCQGEDNSQFICSPLLASFIEKQAPSPQKGTYISRSPRIVQLAGQRIEILTELEFELLCYLYEQRERVCTKYDLIENVYRQQYNYRKAGLSDEMLQALISRLREKIEPDREHPEYILTVRGEGYRFKEPDTNR